MQNESYGIHVKYGYILLSYVVLRALWNHFPTIGLSMWCSMFVFALAESGTHTHTCLTNEIISECAELMKIFLRYCQKNKIQTGSLAFKVLNSVKYDVHELYGVYRSLF